MAHELGAGQVVEGELVGEELANLMEMLVKFGCDLDGLHLDQVRILNALAAAHALQQQLREPTKKQLKTATCGGGAPA